MILPSSTLDDLLFPMTADVYYAETIQTDYGNVVKRWVRDRQIECSIISDMSRGTLQGEVKTKGNDIIYDSNLFCRTKEDIRLKSNNKWIPIVDIAVTNIKDPLGKPVFINGQNQLTSAASINTKYEVKTIVPTFDYNHNFRYNRIFLSKSQVQKWDGS